jgi:hypothetical protein
MRMRMHAYVPDERRAPGLRRTQTFGQLLQLQQLLELNQTSKKAKPNRAES